MVSRVQRLIGIVLVTLTGVVPGLALARQSERPALWFAAGKQALAQGNLVEAEADFLKVVKVQPDQAGAWVNLGVIAMRQKNWPVAMERLTRAGHLDPEQPGIRLNLGLVYFRQEKYEQAISPLRSVLRQQPDSLQAAYLLGLCDFLTRRDADAVKVLEPLWAREQTDFTYLYVLGVAADAAHRPDLQKKAELQLYQVGHDSPEFALILGRAYLNRDQAPRAVAVLEQAATADPHLPLVHFNLGVAYQKMQKLDQARHEFLADIALEPDVAYDYEHLGAIASKLGRDDEAEHWFRQALQRDPKLATSDFGLAEVLLRKRELRQAMQAITNAERLAPDSASVAYLKGRIWMAMGNRAKAQADFLQATRLRKTEQDRLEQQISGSALPRMLPGQKP